jgi:hypothetical protein
MTTVDEMIVSLVHCTELPMFEGHPLIVTAQLEAFQVEITLLYNRNGCFALTRSRFCVPADSCHPTGQLATLSQPDFNPLC